MRETGEISCFRLDLDSVHWTRAEALHGNVFYVLINQPTLNVAIFQEIFAHYPDLHNDLLGLLNAELDNSGFIPLVVIIARLFTSQYRSVDLQAFMFVFTMSNLNYYRVNVSITPIHMLIAFWDSVVENLGYHTILAYLNSGQAVYDRHIACNMGSLGTITAYDYVTIRLNHVQHPLLTGLRDWLREEHNIPD